MTVVLTQWVIYVNPADLPGRFVMREWHIVDGEPAPVPGRAWKANTLEQARELIPAGAIRHGRQRDDDPVILETWT